MRFLFNSNWKFIKGNVGADAAASVPGVIVDLPHTWNTIDGQDGKNDYYRGTCWYVKCFGKPQMAADNELWIEFRGAAMTAEVYLNGEKLARHEGGYSTFRVNLTPALKERNTLVVSVDNGKNRTVYPQKADFTFYGGIYRDVYLINVPKAHFALDHFGSNGIKVTPVVCEDMLNGKVTVETWQTADCAVNISVAGQTKTVKSENGYAKVDFEIENVRLWNGKADPYLYNAKAELESGDVVSADFGFRTIAFDANKGFILNGKPYPLCGAARHQDRWAMGNAITAKEHEEDISIMLEMGANTVRLAHYQHDQYFYDLCDKYGMIAWAEIPYITEHMPEARANTLSQMQELVVQNYNHPSIICWGLSNEITATGGVNDDMIENHKLLNDLCHKLDATRPTTMAHVFMLDPNDPFVMLPDIRSYNLYYGWYVGEYGENDRWFDEFHAAHPDAVIGLSEYGADANPKYQNGRPEKGDWSEPYQAEYHEHLLKMWSERPYIWAMHCWNMFDFGADGRDEGGKPGQNQKGLVTFDRKTRKDAFYIYKAYLSNDPFVHLCGSRYIERTESETVVKVYSNQSSVTLYVDGIEFGTQQGEKVFIFNVPISGVHKIEAVSGSLRDEINIRKVDSANKEYRKDGGEVINWFDREDEIVKEGYFSIKDSMKDIKANPESAKILEEMLLPLQEKAKAAYGDVAQNIKLPQSMLDAMERMSLEATLKQMSKLVKPEFVHKINAELNKVKK